jgi:hypothetical protein
MTKKTHMPVNTDVIVVGAGASGVPAAIAAARTGVKVILLEEDMVPGGAPVDMYVTQICGGPRMGIYREMIQKLNAEYSLSDKPIKMSEDDGMNHWYLPGSFVQVLLQMIAQEKNITLLCGAMVVDTIVKESGNSNKVIGVRILRKDGALQNIMAEVTIDATGTGFVAAQAGCPIMYGREAMQDFDEPFGPNKADYKVQRCTWMYISQRIKPDATLPFSKIEAGGFVDPNINHWIVADKKENYIASKAGIYLHWGATAICNDTCDTVEIAKTQHECMEKMDADIMLLRQSGFAVYLAPKLGIRECRRVRCEKVITVNDLKSGKMPKDIIAVAEYSLDSWGESLTSDQIKLPRYGIPYRSLIPLHFEGILIAGKSIGGTHLAASSYRVQPIVASIGQAAGTAAAMAVMNKTSLRSIEIKHLQKKLCKDGTLLSTL